MCYKIVQVTQPVRLLTSDDDLLATVEADASGTNLSRLRMAYKLDGMCYASRVVQPVGL